MADTLTTQNAVLATVPTASIIATDDTGATGHAQIVKLAVSTDGSITLIPATAASGMLVDLGLNNDVTVTGSVDVTDDATRDLGKVDVASLDQYTPVAGRLPVDGSGVTQPISAVALPLPAGASTSALQTTGNTSLSTIAGAVAGTEMQVDVITMPAVVVSGSVTADTELPAAAALADNAANPTAPAVGAFNMVFDGATWDRLPGTSANGALVDLGLNNDVTVTGTVTANLAAGTNNIGDVDVLTVPAPLSTTGGGTEAAALRVTIANDSTGLVSVDDNGASLTVDGTVTANLAAGTNNIGDVDILSIAAGDNLIGRMKLSDGTDVADVLDLANSNPLTVAIVDGTGNQITSFGGGTQYTEDDAAAANPVGTQPVMVRADTPGAVTTTNGDVVAQRATDYGAAYVQVVSSAGALIDSFGGSGGTAQADRSAFTDGTTTFTPVGGVYDESMTDPTDPQAAAVRLTAKRAIHVNLRDATGAEVSVGGGTQYDEDTASGAADKITMAGAVRKDTAASLVDTDGDRTEIQVDGSGRLWVNNSGVTQPISAASLPLPTGAATSANQTTIIGHVDGIEGLLTTVAGAVAGTEMQVDVLTMPTTTVQATNLDIRDLASASDSVSVLQATASNLNAQVVGPAAHDSAASGNPLLLGAEFDDTLPDAVDEGDIGKLRISANRNLYATIRDAAGNERGLNVDASGNIGVTDAGGVLTVDGTVNAAQSGTWNINNVSGTVSLPTGASTLAEQQTQTTALQLIDDTVATVASAIPAKGIAVAGTDGTNARILKTDTGGELQIDVLSIAAGTNNIGDVDILTIAAGDNNIGNVDIVTVPAPLSTTGGGTEATALRVTIANDSTGVVSVDDNGSSLTVDGTVTANLAAGTNNIGDVDVLSIVPGTGATNLGKAEDGAHTTGDVGVMALGVRTDSPDTARADANADYVPISVSSTGAVRIAPISEDFAVLANGPQVKRYYTSAGAVTDGIVWTPAAGKRWYVTDIFLNVSAAATVTLEDDLVAGDSVVWKAELAANSGWSHSFSTPLFSGEDAADLLVTTTAGNIYITIVGYEI